MLHTKFRLRIPAGIKQHEQRLDMVARRDLQELIDTFSEPLGIFLPYQIMQEHAHRIHAQVLCPTEFPVDLPGIEALRLPHLQLVNGVVRDIVAADQPRLLSIPGFGSFFGPARCLRMQTSGNDKDDKGDPSEYTN